MRPIRSATRLLLALGLPFLAFAGPEYVAPSLVRVRFEGTPHAAIERIQELEGEVVARGRGWFDALVPGQLVREGIGLGLTGDSEVEVLRADADEELAAFRGRTDAGSYHTYEEVKAEIDSLVAARPNLIHYESIGTTVEGRPIHAVRIGAGSPEGKPKFLVCGLHHAREWISVEVPVAFMKQLVTGYDDQAWIKSVLDTRVIWVVPVVNPDGLRYSQNEYKMWRKNRASNHDGSTGVDPNRNYGYNWGLPGASPTPSSDTYRGPEAFSEPEIKAIRDLGLRERFVSALSFHSYSELVLWPWGYTYDPAPDDDVLAFHGRQMGAMTGYTPQQSSDLYPTSGDFDDWFYGELGTLAYTFELGTQFVPPESEIPGIVEPNLKALRYFVENCADPFPLMTHTRLPDTTDSDGPYAARLQLAKRYQADDPVAKAELVYLLPGADESVRVPMTTTTAAAGLYEASIPGAGYGRVDYRFEVTELSGKTHRYPGEGTHSFQVVDKLYLVVDDDAGKNYEAAYVEALVALGLPFRVASSQGLKSVDLLAATAVVWFTGDDSTASLTSDEQALLRSYLEAGGELLLFGQDIGYDIKGEAFFSEVLKAEFVKDKSGDNALGGAAGSFLEGFAARLNEPGAVAQRYPEVIKARTGAAALLAYGGNEGVAALAVDSAARIAYFGFGLEGIAPTEVRDQLLARSLAWCTASGAARKARRAEALRALAPGGADPEGLARLEAEVLAEAAELGKRSDREGLERLVRELPESAKRPVLRAYTRSLPR